MSLVAFFASGPYMMLVAGLAWVLVFSILLDPGFNSIPRAYGWIRSLHREPGLFVIRASFLFVSLTFTLFIIAFWW